MSATKLQASFLPGERWWGGAVHDGTRMPLTASSDYAIDLRQEQRGNQSMPLFLSTKGRYLWCDQGFSIRFAAGVLRAESSGAPLELKATGGGLREAYLAAMKAHFPFDPTPPEALFYTRPQYNTWVELLYQQNQEGVLAYARSVLANGLAPGVLMIDDTWQEDYGLWRFHPGRFPNPKAMCRELHDLGFSVMVWLVPYLSADSPSFRKAQALPGALLRRADGEPVLLSWWNGYSAALDLRQASARALLDEQLHALQEEVGVDGFKFDGGGLNAYAQAGDLGGATPSELNQAWFQYAASYRFHEAKDSWKAGGRAINQRLRDKDHAWEGEGLACILPDAFNASLTGHPYLCPDMVGGGEWTCFLPGGRLDEELLVRCAQASALFPMLQFSVAPWRVLSGPALQAVLEAGRLHERLGGEIYRLVCQTAKTGEPLLTPLCYYYPQPPYAQVLDEFLLGRDLLVCPVLQKGCREREVVFPPGLWQGADGTRYPGGQTLRLAAPLETLLYFRRVPG